MLLNDDIVDIEKLDEICSPTFVIGKFSGLFLKYKRKIFVNSNAREKRFGVCLGEDEISKLPEHTLSEAL